MVASARDGSEITESKTETATDSGVVSYSTAGAVFFAIFGLAMFGVFAVILAAGGSAGRFAFAVIPLAFGAFCLLVVWRMSQGGQRAIVIDKDALDVRFLNRNRVRIPWSEVSGIREKTDLNDQTYVVLDLRAPRSHFLVEEGKPSFKRSRKDRPTLAFPSSRLMLDTKRERLLEMIQAHLPDADDRVGPHE